MDLFSKPDAREQAKQVQVQLHWSSSGTCPKQLFHQISLKLKGCTFEFHRL